MSDPSIERPLGPTEEMYWRFDALSPLNFAVMARLAGPLDLEAFSRALAALQGRHPLLRVHVAEDAHGIPWFREGAAPIPTNVVDAEPSAAWSTLEAGLNTSIDTVHGPLLQATLLRHGTDDHTLVIRFHHSISDGRSATFLLRDLLESLARQACGESPDLEPLPPAGYYGDRIPDVDAKTSMGDFQNAWKTVKAAAHFMRGAGVPVGMPRVARRPTNLASRHVYVEVRTIEGPNLKLLLERAREERTTIQCVLNAALSLAVAQAAPTRGLERTGCSQVIDIRGRLEPPVGEDCGLFATGLTSLHTIGPDTQFWPFAREIREHMDEAFATPLPFFHSAMHSLLTNLTHGLGLSDRKVFSRVMQRIHPEGLAVSNLGRVEVRASGSPVEVTEIAFATNTTVLNDLSTSAITFAGRMTWAFNGSAGLTRPRIAEVADRAVDLIAKAVPFPA